MDSEQLRDLIRDILYATNLIKYEDEREIELLMLTAAVESNLGQYIEQKGGGPARGIFQMEKNTEDDIWKNYLKYKEHLALSITEYMCNFDSEMKWNLAYQILMCRIHYLRIKEVIPTANDVVGLAKYYKRFYNTYLGKSSVDRAVEKYKRHVK